MATPIGVVGFASSGKSTGLENLSPKETFIISPFKSELPITGFESNYTQYNPEKKTGNFMINNKINVLPAAMKYVSEKRPEIKYLVIEDITHFFNAYTLSKDFRQRGKTKDSWARWGDFGADTYQALFANMKELRDDLFIIMHFHPEQYIDNGMDKLKLKTPGTLLEREVDIPSYFNYLLYTRVFPYDPDNPSKERYFYVTNDDGYAPAKTPKGMYKPEEMYIPNDMMSVIKRLKKFKKAQ